MRKQIFYSLVASALLVGCTADEMIAPVQDNAGIDLSKRPSLGQVTLGVGDEATRIAIQDGSAFAVDFVDGDKIGACIVDAPDLNKKVTGHGKDGANNWSSREFNYLDYVKGNTLNVGSGRDARSYTFEETKTKKGGDVNNSRQSFYDITEYISTNYPYTKSGSIWTSPANMVEGNYFFYAPYNQGFLTRNPLVADLPLDQDCSEAEGSVYDTKYQKDDVKSSSKAINDLISGATPSLIGYKFLKKENSNKPSVKTYNLYAYPMFTIVNDFNGYLFEGKHDAGSDQATSVNKQKKTITIDRVEIYYNGKNANPIFNKAPFSFQGVKDNLAGDWDAANFTTGTKTADVLGEATNAYTHNARFDSDAKRLAQEPRLPDARRDIATIGANHIMCNVNKTLQNGEKYHFHAVMPAGDYGNDLYARVYVTIDGKKYVMLTGNTAEKQIGNDGKWNTGDDYVKLTKKSNADYQLIDKTNGSQYAVFIRGQHYPMAEYVINQAGEATGTKSFAGQMLTINLSKTMAFQLNDLTTADPNTYGFNNNSEFISYVQDNVQRGVKLVEISNRTAQANWKKVGGAGAFALKDGTQCKIDAQFIHDIYAQTMPQIVPDTALLKFKTHLPIMNDVEVVKVCPTNDTLTFKAVKDGVTRNYMVHYVSVQTVNKENNNVLNGYNVINDKCGELNAAGKNAIVEIKSTGSATINNCSGINIIYLNGDAKLTVKGDCTARVIVRGGAPTIEIQNGGKLANTGNYLKGAAITNNVLAEINGSEIGTVSATFDGWPANVLPANSRVNNITINCAATTQIINQAQINKFQNLSKVNLTLTGVTEIQSSENVTLNNMKSITSTSVQPTTWKQTTSTTDNITINRVKLDGNWTAINNITADGLVSWNPNL